MRIAVIAGGRTPERDVSLRGGHRVVAALAELGHDAWQVDPADVALVESLRSRAPDLCWLSLHGKEGEDGTIQRLLDVLGIPFTGTAAFEAELTFDKVLAKDALRRAGVRTPDWVVIEDRALRDLGAGDALAEAVARVGLPCVVKPSRSGSALGVMSVERESDVAHAVLGALSFSDAAVIESKVLGTEVAVAAIGSPLELLPPVEIVPKDGVYDYGARYTAGATDYFVPARLDPDTTGAVHAIAAQALAAVGTRDLGRVDLIVDATGSPSVLEANVSPGMTETSLVPMAALGAGMSFEVLCDRIIQAARART